MADKSVPCPTVLRQLLRYEPETGKLFWLHRGPEWFKNGQKTAAHNCAVWNARYSNKEAFTAIGSHGYMTGSVLDIKILAHRAVFALEFGLWPEFQVDHINGNKLDNRLANLRSATNAENARNMSLSSANKSGVTGVFWLSEYRKWLAYIGICGGKRENLGRFNRIEDAIIARKSAEIRHGYHQNHGKG